MGSSKRSRPSRPRKCEYLSPWGRCQQRRFEQREPGGPFHCSFHHRWNRPESETPDPTYHRKIVEGLLEPTDDYLSDAELNATLRGRVRADGRRLDEYVPMKPYGYEAEMPVEDWEDE